MAAAIENSFKQYTTEPHYSSNKIQMAHYFAFLFERVTLTHTYTHTHTEMNPNKTHKISTIHPFNERKKRSSGYPPVKLHKTQAYCYVTDADYYHI